VKFNGQDYKGGIDKLKILPQTIRFKIEQEYCTTIEESYTLMKSEEKVFELYPEDISALLTIKTHANATVKFNAESHKGGLEKYKIAPQVLQICVEMPKAETVSRMITLKPKAEESLEIFPEVHTGTIQVMVIPSEAGFELHGDAGEYYQGSGRQTFMDVPVGKYELEAKADGYKTYKESFELKSDETLQKPVQLEEGSDVPDWLVFVEGGSFDMGSNDGDSDEKPVHRVTLSDFYIGKYEVTQEQYEKVMGKNPSNFKDSGKDAPVEKVTWYDAVEFCNKLSEQEGLQKCFSGSGNSIKCDFSKNGYRLPTEAEWEYAAKGGSKSKGYKYSGSNNLDEVGWYRDNSGGKTHSVGGKKANELGIYDMSGNVWEWCWDWYGDYSSSAQTNPHGQGSGSVRVVRGGSWGGNARGCRRANRYYNGPASSGSFIGFRLSRANPY
jgi:formylglycine-generating enzyme